MDEELRRRVFRRDGWTCQGCGAQGGPEGDAELHADHVVPKSAGGRDSLANLTTRCGSCHAQRHQNPHIDHGGRGRRRRRRVDQRAGRPDRSRGGRR